MKHSILALASILIFACGASSDTGVNKSHYVGPGEHKKGGLRSVNGAITVDEKAIVEGDCSTVNGRVSIGEGAHVGEISCVNGGIGLDKNAHAEDISCVNGSIELGSKVVVAEDVGTVNGSIRCDKSVSIHGNMSTVNGEMRAKGTLIAGDVSTVNGDISLTDGSEVGGTIYIDRDQPRSRMNKYKKLTVRIDDKSVVKGDIEVKGDDPNVTVVLAGGGEVLGKIINAEIVRE